MLVILMSENVPRYKEINIIYIYVNKFIPAILFECFRKTCHWFLLKMYVVLVHTPHVTLLIVTTFTRRYRLLHGVTL